MNKQTAQKIAQQIARESNEVLKSAREQIMPSPEVSHEKSNQSPNPSINTSPSGDVKNKDSSFMQAYKSELKEISQQELFNKLQKKISEGEEVPLIDYAYELTSEQREVLKAQMEAMKLRKESIENQKSDSIPQIVSKRARGMLNNFKKRNQQHVELRQPPSN